MKTKLIVILALGISLLSAQQRATVAISKGTPDSAVTTLLFDNASSQVAYICKAPPTQPPYYWNVTSTFGHGTLTSIAVLTNVATATTGAAHGLLPGNL